jgi:predicted DCC family thiol-disulfide oxidoreductase YuxK
MVTGPEAILFILEKLPRFCWLARLGHLCPAAIRNLLYRLIAVTRYSVWGQRDSCWLPTPEEKIKSLP